MSHITDVVALFSMASVLVIVVCEDVSGATGGLLKLRLDFRCIVASNGIVPEMRRPLKSCSTDISRLHEQFQSLR